MYVVKSGEVQIVDSNHMRVGESSIGIVYDLNGTLRVLWSRLETSGVTGRAAPLLLKCDTALRPVSFAVDFE
jgi:hypothetical protein